MGFGGINSHVTLSSGDAPAPHLKPALEVRSLLASPQETELFVLSATSLEGLLEQVLSVSEQAAGMSSAELVDLAAHLALNSAPVQSVRAAMLASTPDELAERLQQIAHLLRHQPPKTGESSVLDQSIWLSNHVKRNRIGFLFPGQGSQKLNMSRTLVERYGWAQDLIHQCDQWLAEWMTKPLESVMYRALERAVSHAEIAQWQQELSQTEIAQPAVCLASLLWCRRLERLGLKPAVVGGHSLGELTAFQAAGAFDEQTLLKLAAVRGQAMKASDQSGAMVSLSCSQTKAQALLRLVSGYGVVANLNSPQQTVISGEVKTLAAVVKLAEAQEIRTRVLPVSAAFHSRLIASSAQALQAISFLPQSLGELSCMLFSSVPGSQIQHGLNLREHFATQVSSQVDFISLAHAVAANCDLLIEVGPGQVLSRLTHDFDNLGQRCLPIESKPSHDEDLNRILATFFIQGGEINWTALYEDRFIRPFVPASARQFIENPCERPYPLQALATPRDSSVTNTESAPSETLLPHNTNLEATLSQYFVEHSAFIAQLIAKDLRAFESSPQRSSTLSQVHTHSGETSLQQPSDVLTSDSFASRNGKLLVPPIPSHPRTTELERLDPKFDTTNIHEFLFQLVEEQTGFPTATLSLHSRLLDDLNLDSIKAAELIATAAKRLGVGGTLDPNFLANATLKDLISTLRSAQTQTESIKSGMLGDTQTLEPESSWVRNFSFTYIPQALPVATPHWTANSWTTAKVLIVAEATEQDLVNALNQQLEALGAQTNSVSYSDSALQQQCSSATYCLAILPRSSVAQLPLEHLIARLQSIAQPRAQLNTCLAYIQFGGGEYGRSGLEHPATCCAAAFARSLHLEQPHQRIRVIDLSTELETQEMAQSILQELVGSEGIATVGYDRHGLRYGPQVAVQQPITYKPRTISWSAKDVILVTGGAKGITAECALAFAQSTGASMALVGRSPTPTLDDSSSEVAQTLARFQSLGIPHRYYPCDITETVAVQDLITAVIQDLGPIAGLIHGAGLNQPRRQETVKLEEAYCEVSPKLLGAENLLQHLEASTLKMVVGFSSIIAITGMPGNAWYGFANEVLDLQLRHYHHQHPATQVLSLAYSVWDEVGMGARLGSVTTLERMGIAAIPVSEGVQRFLKLMHFNPGDNQVIITARLGGLDTWSPISLPDSASLRFIERVTSIEPGVELVTRTKLRLEQDYYLQDHFWRGSHLFPTVFGLEAMVQASAYVMGTLAPTVARIESISLLRPIVVDPKVGVELEIHAEVLETTVLGEQQIHVSLRTEQTGFSLDHFSATVVLSPRDQESPLALDLTEPLDLDPQTDLYGNLLFQGQRFQRMETLYRLTSTQAVLQTSIQPQVDQARNSFAGLGRVLLLGDPYVRDVLLQSVQLTIPQDLCLPVYIERIEWFNASACSDERIVTAQLLHKEGEEYFANVVATDPKGTVLERITGYRIRILEQHPANPTAADLVSPIARDQQILERILGTMKQQSIGLPAIALEYQKKSAVSSEEPLIAARSAVAKAIQLKLGSSELLPNVEIQVLPSGKFTLKNFKNLHLGIAHCDRYCLAVIGDTAQGCHIEPVSPQPTDHEIEPTPAQAQVLAQLIAQGDSANLATARLRSAIKAVHQALNRPIPDCVRIEASNPTQDVVLLRVFTTTGPYQVATAALRFTRPPERVVAFVVTDSPVHPLKTLECESAAFDNTITTEQQSTETIANRHSAFYLQDGPQNQLVYQQRFQVSFKESGSISRRIYFSQYFRWIGKIRELPMEQIADQILADFLSGDWGMVTNAVSLRVLGEATAYDVVQARAWVAEVTGSSFTTYIEFCKVRPDQTLERLAMAEVRATWVYLKSYGVPTPMPFPYYLQDYLDQFGAQHPADAELDPMLPHTPGLPPLPAPLSQLNLGETVAQSLGQHSHYGRLLRSEVFQTTLEESNLVGNVYYGNYFIWQGRILDLFLYSIAPEYLRVSNARGEMLCLYSRMDYLREAMPFDRIRTMLYVQSVTECGAVFKFEFFREQQDGSLEKLHVGHQEVAWVERLPDGTPVAAPFPSTILKSFLDESDQLPNQDKPFSKTNLTNQT